jgi:hypothetical protein
MCTVDATELSDFAITFSQVFEFTIISCVGIQHHISESLILDIDSLHIILHRAAQDDR